VVTAKIKLAQKLSGVLNDVLTFTVDYADGRNKEWADATPAMTFNMTVKKEVGALFTPGQAFTLQLVEEVPAGV
jgi:hypothetical protein